MSRAPAIALVVGLLLVLSACGDGVDDAVGQAGELTSQAADALASESAAPASSVGLVESLREAGLTTLASAVSTVDVESLTGGEEVTLFAPTDDAFLTLTADQLADLNDDPQLMASMLDAHLVPGVVEAADLADGTELVALDGTSLPVVVDGDTVTVAGATVVESDLAVEGGVAHAIDTVLATG